MIRPTCRPARDCCNPDHGVCT